MIRAFVIVLCLASPVSAQRVFDVATARALPGDVRYSDVFLLGWFTNCLTILSNFNGNRIAWGVPTYTNWSKLSVSNGIKWCGSVSPYDKDFGTSLTYLGRALALDGGRVTAPWQRPSATTNNAAWGCVNQPDWRTTVLASAEAQIDSGANWILFDDQRINHRELISMGACFCSYCVSGFTNWIEANKTAGEITAAGITNLATYDYKAACIAYGAPSGDAFYASSPPLLDWYLAFMKDSVISFHSWFAGELSNYTSGSAILAANVGYPMTTGIDDLFHLSFGEVREGESPDRTTPLGLLSYEKESEGLGRFDCHMLETTNVPLTKCFIAESYAAGCSSLIPYSIWMPGDIWVYGTTNDYAGLFKFVRDYSDHLDGYEDAHFSIYGTNDVRYASHVPVVVTGSTNICAFTRAVPGDAKAPEVVHLVDWSTTPSNFSVALDKSRFRENTNWVVSLLRPGYSPVPLSQVDAVDTRTVIVPALSPWSILEIRLARDAKGNTAHVGTFRQP